MVSVWYSLRKWRTESCAARCKRCKPCTSRSYQAADTVGGWGFWTMTQQGNKYKCQLNHNKLIYLCAQVTSAALQAVHATLKSRPKLLWLSKRHIVCLQEHKSDMSAALCSCCEQVPLRTVSVQPVWRRSQPRQLRLQCDPSGSSAVARPMSQLQLLWRAHTAAKARQYCRASLFWLFVEGVLWVAWHWRCHPAVHLPPARAPSSPLLVRVPAIDVSSWMLHHSDVSLLVAPRLRSYFACFPAPLFGCPSPIRYGTSPDTKCSTIYNSRQSGTLN